MTNELIDWMFTIGLLSIIMIIVSVIYGIQEWFNNRPKDMTGVSYKVIELPSWIGEEK